MYLVVLLENFVLKLQFESLNDPFAITSVIGQALEKANRPEHAVKILEVAHSIGTENLKSRALLMHVLGRVHWGLSNTEKAFFYMEKDLELSTTLDDHASCYRVRGNLGIACFSEGRCEEAVKHYTEQLKMAHSLGESPKIISSLTCLGNVYSKQGDYVKALLVYEDSLEYSTVYGDLVLICRALSNLGRTELCNNNKQKGMMWHHQHLTVAKESGNKMEEAEAYGDLGQVHFKTEAYDQSLMFYQQLLSVAVKINNRTLKSRAYGGMGRANVAMGNLWHAQSCHEQQLKLCRHTRDEEGQASALTELGHVYKAAGNWSQAMMSYSQNLQMAQKLRDRDAEGKAYAYIGSCHITLGNYSDAVGYYQQELNISLISANKSGEATALGHLGTAYFALDNPELALEHTSLQLAQDIPDRTLECPALSNLGHYYTSNKKHAEALPHLERALRLAQEQKDHTNENKVCHNLALCYEALGNYQQSILYYQHDFTVAQKAQDKEGMIRACEKLVKVYVEIGDNEQAEIYRKKVKTIDIQSTSGKCTFWNQIAEDALSSSDPHKAIEYYENLLKEAKKEHNRSFEGLAYCGLGDAYTSRGDSEHALTYFRRYLNICKATGDILGECHAYGKMGAGYNELYQHKIAVDCHDHQLLLAKELDSAVLVCQAYECLGIVYCNMGNTQKALEYHHLQLSSALELSDAYVLEKAKAYGNLGDTYKVVGNYHEAIKHYNQHLMLAQQAQDEMVQYRALESLVRAHECLGNFKRSLFFCKQQLKLVQRMGDQYNEAGCYSDKGWFEMLLGDYSGALESFSCQLHISRQLQDVSNEASAVCGLGEAHRHMGNYREAIDYHNLDLRISSAHQFVHGEACALGNIAETYETFGEYKSAFVYREEQLNVADTVQDGFFEKALAFIGLGKVHIKVGEYIHAITLLKQALSLIINKATPAAPEEGHTTFEVEAMTRFYLGQAFYYQCHYDAALVYLQKALPLLEQHFRQDMRQFDHITMHLVELYPILLQTLISTLVKQGKVEEALEMAEMERNRAMAEALMQLDVVHHVLKTSGLFKSNSSWIQETINTIQTPVLYFSVALNHVFIWLLHPKSGVVQFQQVADFNLDSVYSETSGSYVQPLVDSVAAVREALGPEMGSAESTSDDFDSGEDSESLVGSGSSVSAPVFHHLKVEASAGKTSPHQFNMQPVHELYNALIKPMEQALPKSVGHLTIIPDKELYLVPFSLLKGEGMNMCLYERFHLQFAPSLQSLKATPQALNDANVKDSASSFQVKASQSSLSPSTPAGEPSDCTNQEALVVGCPAVPSNYNWQSLKNVEKEAKLIADLLHSSALLYHSASKDRILKRLASAESVHLAANLSWSQCEVVLAPPDNQQGVGEETGDGAMPDPSQYVLTASEIMESRMCAKLVVVSAAHRSDSPRVPGKGLMCMAQLLLAAGAECVLLPLWPSSFQASRLMMNAFYNSLIYGSKASRALRYAMQVVPPFHI